MRVIERWVVASLCLIVVPRVVVGACPVERSLVRAVADAQAAQVNRVAMPSTIAALHALPAATRPLPQEARVAPVETSIYSIAATLVAYRLSADGSIHLVLADEARRTIVARMPLPGCANGSRFLSEITTARAAFERRNIATDVFKEVSRPVVVQGVGFFDFFQSQRGLAPNAVSLDPVIAIDLNPFTPIAPPAPRGKRRSSVGGAPICPQVSLSLTATPANACSGRPVTIAWQASDPAASVTIDGIGTSLPASGSRVVTATANTVYSGRAITACQMGDEATTVVSLAPPTNASLSGPSSVNTGSSITLSVSTSGASSWTLDSLLGNAISPSSGTTNRTVTYSATRAGTDIVTITTAGGGCEDITRALWIDAITKDQPPPPPQGLRCCDGTFSPTCFNCGNKQGCCSSHGGVCGCPSNLEDEGEPAVDAPIEGVCVVLDDAP